MKYFKGDIVEIVTGEFKSVQDVPAHRKGYFENQGEPIPFIGQRFKVYDLSERNRIQYLYVRYFNRLGNDCLSMGVTSCEVMLYKRPLLNWLKSIFNKTIAE